jgi:hypothetical protein
MKYLYFFVLLSFGLSSCVKNNALPVFLEINNWTLNSNGAIDENDPKALTHNFSDVWIYVDGKNIGVFELPCKIPVLASGTCKVILFPAIKNNGQASTKKVYPFAESFETTIDLIEGETYTFNPTTKYLPNTKFWIEDFENSSIKIVKDASVSNQNLDLEVENNSADWPWGKYGHLSLTSSDSLWVGRQDLAWPLPKSGAEVYLEFDYKNTNSILTGMLEYQLGGNVVDHGGYTAGQQGTNVKWKKIYIDLKDVASNTPNGYAYRQYLRVLLDPGISSSEVYIDNIKVVHF